MLRVAAGVLAALVFVLEGGCSSGAPPSSLSLTAVRDAYERARLRAWDPSRRFKALFKAEVSRKVGASARGYLSVWWDGASGSLTWRSSAPVAGAGRGGFLRKDEGAGHAGAGDGSASGEDLSPLPGRLSAGDLIASILGMPDSPALPSLPFEETPRGWRLRIDRSERAALVDREGRVFELSFPGGEIVKLQSGEGVPRRIEANGSEGRAVLVLESYSSWPEGELVPPA